MKKKLLVLALLLPLVGCSLPDKDEIINSKDDREMKAKDYLGSEYKGNYVWGGAMNLAWNELSEEVIGEDTKLKSRDEKVLSMVESFNNAPFSKEDLDKDSYYVKSGYGQETVDQINKESKEKFPDKSFDDLDFKLSQTDIISYAYFLKEVEYPIEFEKTSVDFLGEGVKGFNAKNKKQKENVVLLDYTDDDKFIVRLELKEDLDQLILAKGYNMENPAEILNQVNKNIKNGEKIGEDDIFKMPELHLNHHRNYVELIGKCFENKSFEGYCIGAMFEDIKFDMDNKGARVENQGVMLISGSAVSQEPQYKSLILDKPFWVIMKQKNSPNPYFILGVNNTSIMKK